MVDQQVAAGGRPYHHGDLPNALRRAAAEVIVERGLGNFSLREVARRAGVSHTAPAHHFGDMEGLLTALAVEGFNTLADAMERAVAGVDGSIERLSAMGVAYVEFSSAHRAHLDVMFRQDVIAHDDATLTEAGVRALALLDDTVRTLIETEQLDADVAMMTTLCWATMQGLVVLAPKLAHVCEVHDLPNTPLPVLVRQFTEVFVAGLRSRH